MLARQLQLQEWDLQDITKEERGRGPICASGEEYEDESTYTFTYYYSYHSLHTEQMVQCYKSNHTFKRNLGFYY